MGVQGWVCALAKCQLAHRFLLSPFVSSLDVTCGRLRHLEHLLAFLWFRGLEVMDKGFHFVQMILHAAVHATATATTRVVMEGGIQGRKRCPQEGTATAAGCDGTGRTRPTERQMSGRGFAMVHDEGRNGGGRIRLVVEAGPATAAGPRASAGAARSAWQSCWLLLGAFNNGSLGGGRIREQSHGD